MHSNMKMMLECTLWYTLVAEQPAFNFFVSLSLICMLSVQIYTPQMRKQPLFLNPQLCYVAVITVMFNLKRRVNGDLSER